ncbi:MAG: recombinase family protein [Terriglobales bacterium]
MDNTLPMRYTIYARYSSDLQRPSSIADQIRKCEEFGRTQGWTKDGVYSDAAISGVSTERPGLQRMLAAAFSAHRPFDVILVDDTSRISRSLSDAVQLFEKLRFAGLRVIAVGQGIDTRSEQADVLLTVHGLVDSLYVKELAKKTHRGLEGAFLRGLHAGGRCYGYRNMPVEGGVRLEIDEREAAVVRRIFEMSAHGMSLKTIAATLNAEKVPSPRPRATSLHATWAPTAIREMLRRDLYRGRVIWNRSRFIKVPGTNKRVARPRPRSEWRISERPELRIISEELWKAVQARQTRMQELYGGKHGLFNRSASSGNLFTGFLKCGCCGANLVIVTGRRRRHAMYGCPQHFYRGACTNGLRIRQHQLEDQLFRELQQAVLRPEVIDHVLDQFTRQLKGAQTDFSKHKERAQARKKELTEQLDRLTLAIAEGGHSAALLDAIAQREQELSELERILDPTKDSLAPDPELLRAFATHRLSALPELMSHNVARARAELSRHATQVTMTPAGSERQRYYTCHGNWDLLGTLRAEGDVRMVAGGGFEPPTFGL